MKRIKLCTALVVFVLLIVPCITVRADNLRIFRMNDANITYYGRWDNLSNGGVQLNFESGFEVSFTGTSVSIEFGDGGYARRFIYSIDGADPKQVVDPPVGRYTLASNLSAGKHILSLYSGWETTRLPIDRLVLDAGGTLSKTEKKKKIEFIGDSITAGWLGGTGSTSGLINCYTWQVAKELGFAYNVVAYGGIGLTHGGNGEPLSMAERYFKALPYQSGDTAWPNLDASKYTPDYIVVNLTTNDRDRSEAYVKTAYINFAARLRETYPKAVIFLVGTFGGWNIIGQGGYFKDAVSGAVEARRAAGDNNITFIDTTGWMVRADYADELHFTPAGNRVIANKLSAAIKSYLSGGEPTASQGSSTVSPGAASSSTASSSTASSNAAASSTTDSGTNANTSTSMTASDTENNEQHIPSRTVAHMIPIENESNGRNPVFLIVACCMIVVALALGVVFFFLMRRRTKK